MTLFRSLPPLQLNPKDTVMNCVGWWDLVFLFVLLSFITSVSHLDVVVAVEGSVQRCSFYSLGDELKTC